MLLSEKLKFPILIHTLALVCTACYINAIQVGEKLSCMKTSVFAWSEAESKYRCLNTGLLWTYLYLRECTRQYLDNSLRLLAVQYTSRILPSFQAVLQKIVESDSIPKIFGQIIIQQKDSTIFCNTAWKLDRIRILYSWIRSYA